MLKKSNVLIILKGKLLMYEKLLKIYGIDLDSLNYDGTVDREIYEKEILKKVPNYTNGDFFNHVYLITVINKLKERIKQWEQKP